MGRDTDILDRLLEKPCYIMDVLPRQVERDAEGSFFDVEDYLLNGGRRFGFRDRFVAVILKLMCYYRAAVLWDGWVDRPSPAVIDEAVSAMEEHGAGTLRVLFAEEDALLIFDWDCLHLTVYNPSEEFGSLAERIAWSEGVLWRKGEPAGTGRGVVL